MNNVERQGFTLIEVLITITIMAITLVIGVPFLGKLVEQSERKSTLNQLLTGINFARTQAITRSSNITLCPLDKQNRCSKDWNLPLTIFVDPARQRQLTDPADTLRILIPPKQGILYGRTGIRKHFGFRPTGMARASIGHLLWCPDDGEARDAFQIRINMGGRAIRAIDNNGDGIEEDAYGKNISCP